MVVAKFATLWCANAYVDGMSHAVLQEPCASRKDGPGSNGSTVRLLSNQEVTQHGLSQHVAMFHKA